MHKFIWIVSIVLSALHFGSAYKILVVFPLGGKSHAILGNGYVRHLLDAGHEVTYITPFPTKTSQERLHQIDVSSNLKLFPVDLINIKSIMDEKVDLSDMSLMLEMMFELIKQTILHENVQVLLNDVNQNFDVAITEWMFGELYAGFSGVFNCPLIWSSSVEPHWMMLRLIDEVTNPAYVPSFDSNENPPFTFVERVKQLGILTLISLYKWFNLSNENKVYYEAFGPPALKRGLKLPAYEEIIFNASLILGNSYAPLSVPVHLPKNYKEIGGYHINSHIEPLPEKLQKIMDSSENGVIYFSMGSNLRSQDLPDELKRDLLKMFGQFKQTVLWKFEEDLKNLPKNVHILPWAPQPSILAHPNCVLFITHGGLLSITETVYYGVPIIGIPVFADQFTNIEKAVAKGYGKRVNLSYDLVKHLNDAIEEVLSNPRYHEKVKGLSAIFRDRPLAPGAELVYWVEHVVRTGGAPHLRSLALIVPWYQKMYLDLVALIFLIIFIIVKLVKKICSNKRKALKEKKNK